jgi:hypothetical protein
MREYTESMINKTTGSIAITTMVYDTASEKMFILY